MPVLKRADVFGPQFVFVTTTIVDWYPIFRDRMFAKQLLVQLHETTECFYVKVVSYVLMPSHIHMIVFLNEYRLISTFMQSFKSLSARRIRVLLPNEICCKFIKNEKFQLWMPRFDDLVLFSEKQLKTKIDYIHNNPVKGNLVEHPEDWVFSSANDWIGNTKGIIPIYKDVF